MSDVLRVLLLSDGRPGHFRQSEGIAAALARRQPIHVDRLELHFRRSLSKGLLPRIARLLPPSAFLRLAHGASASHIAKPDVVISAGGATIGANAALAKIFGVPNIFAGSLRGLPAEAFRMVLLPYPSAATHPAITITPKPSPIDLDRLPPPKALRSAEDLMGLRITLMLGGPTPKAPFDSQDWQELGGLCEALLQEWRASLSVVTSRRTPDDAYGAFEPVLERWRDQVTLIDYRRSGAGSIDQSLDTDLVMVTADSMSMMTEAAFSRRPAIALAPRGMGVDRDTEAVEALVQEGWLGVCEINASSPSALGEMALTLSPMAENHLDRLARLLAPALSSKAPPTAGVRAHP